MAKGRFTVEAQDDGRVHVDFRVRDEPTDERETMLKAATIEWDMDADLAENLGGLLIRKAQRARQLRRDR